MTYQYCAWIHEQDRTYPVRTGTRDLDSEAPRCDWHWRFTCDVCGRPSHFNRVTWCEATRQFTCLWCAPHRLQEGNPQLAAVRRGLSREQDTSRLEVARQVLPPERVVTDEEVAARWNAVTDRWYTR